MTSPSKPEYSFRNVLPRNAQSAAVSPCCNSFHLRTTTARGFALVVTLSLMVLLTVIAVGLLSISVVTLRSTSVGQAQMQARANARLALQLAIGELQRNAGADTRVTASADILDADSSSPWNLAVTGVWKSWEGSDHTTSGAAAARPIPPDYPSKQQSASSSSGRFLSWLVSKPISVDDSSLISNDPNWSVSTALSGIVRNSSFVDPVTPSKISVPLLSTGSLAAGDPRQVHVMPLEIKNSESQRGAYAWWVSGENQKARLPVPYKPANDNDAAAWSVQAKSHAVADPGALQMEPVLDPGGPDKAAKALSLGTSTLLVPNEPLKNPAKQFHDMSASSVGLLTNTATGGWRKDLSLFTENWDKLPDTGAEVFRITPDASAAAKMTKPKKIEDYNAITPDGSVFYPWSRYRIPPIINDRVRARPWTAAVTSWHHLKDYAILYKAIALQASKPTMAPRLAYGELENGASNNAGVLGITEKQNLFNYLHTVRVMPLLARTHLVFFVHSEKITSGYAAGKYRVNLRIAPVHTLWNPYNVTLGTTPQMISYPRGLPAAVRFEIGGKTSEYHFLVGQGRANNEAYQENGIKVRSQWVYIPENANQIRSTLHKSGQVNPPLEPGVTRTFTHEALGYLPAFIDGNFKSYIKQYGPVLDATGNPTLDASGNPILGKVDLICDAEDNIKVNARFDTIQANYGNGNVVGAYVDVMHRIDPSGAGDTHRAPKPIINRIGYSMGMANTLWPPMAQGDFPSFTVGSVEAVQTPFLSMIYGLRLASDTHFPAKGFLQSNPMVSSSEMGLGALAQVGGQQFYGSTRGIINPVNAAFDFSFVTHTGLLDSRLPNSSQDGKNRGYIINGSQAGDGLSRIVIAELPLRPLSSLAELQHWDLRAENNVPPYQSYVIANSDAQPLFAPDAVVGTNPQGVKTPTSLPNNGPQNNLQHDDSYCANHLLFDDWFFSSIAPQPTTFGPTGKTLQETFEALVRDGEPLDNRAYRPILEDRGIGAAQATDLFNAKVNASESYRSIASRLEVDGMFNVNSTSVKAWRALLGHARNQRVPYYNNAGDMVLSDSTDFATSRTTVASDVAAGENGSSGTFPGASEFSGYRAFTDAMLDQMAEEMVKQVSLRGPFLSLSEFVNRQLSVDKNLALAGAVQSALNGLAANANADTNPFKELQDNSLDAGQSVLAAQGKQADSDYTYFTEASEGKSAYGVPGWPRQADILRPLAPILTVRDDTFTIRAYGDARDANGKVIARATCEAIVRRSREFVSATDDAADITGPPTAAANDTFGRRFQIISFRWLHANEI